LLRKESGGEVFIGEHELALSMLRHVLSSMASAK
jgi:CPA2 family monovalent cation:H+ antiporter-2